MISVRSREEYKCLENLKFILQLNRNFVDFILYGDKFSANL